MLVVLWFFCLQKIQLVGCVSAKTLVRDFGKCFLWVKILDQPWYFSPDTAAMMGPKSLAILELLMELAKPLECEVVVALIFNFF